MQVQFVQYILSTQIFYCYFGLAPNEPSEIEFKGESYNCSKNNSVLRAGLRSVMAEEPLFTALCLRCEASAGGANSGRLDGGPSETGSVTVPTAELVPSQRLRQCPRPPCAVIKGRQMEEWKVP